jgi:hypothetical protein
MTLAPPSISCTAFRSIGMNELLSVPHFVENVTRVSSFIFVAHFFISNSRVALFARSLKTLLSTVAEMALRLTAVLPQHSHALRSLACLARNGRAVKSKAMQSQHQHHRGSASASASSSYEESIDILDIDINELLPLDPASCASLHLVLCASLSRFTLVGRIKLHEPATLEPPAAAKMSAWPADQGVRLIYPSIFPSFLHSKINFRLPLSSIHIRRRPGSPNYSHHRAKSPAGTDAP